ncbi:NrdH-like glutaredoxin [Microbacterium phage Barnstormer]|uniref:NrdH-like glutaredoxin n=1 Tax=Microbacterium phage Barnstormer TaxID=3028491 RepID=A0AAE9ZJI0_9CAUD|nr:NrdH-like glutaredoxin [Microbacterium phage Barnstormer]
MATLTVHTKSLSHCPQCDLTIKTALREGLAVDERPGIDTPEREDELAVFKTEHKLAAAPIVEARDELGRVVDRWAGFRPDKIKEHA